MTDHPSTIEPPLLASDPRLQQVRALLRRVERRFRLQEAASLLPWAAAPAAGAIVVLAALHRFWSGLSLDLFLLASVGVVVASLLSVVLYALFRPRDLLSTARTADRLLGLDERLSTALEDAASTPARPTPGLLALRDAQLDDAVQSIAWSRPERDLPLKFDRRKLLPTAALFVALVAALFVPNFGANATDNAASAQVATEQKNIDILKQSIQAQPRAAQDPTLKKLLQELDALSHDLKEGNLSKEEALARLSQTESDLQKALDAQSPAQREALDQLAKQLSASGNEAARQAGEALKQGDTQKAADDLKKAAGDVSKMTAQERQALTDTLRKARDSAAALDPELASRLNDAADALENAEPKAAEQALNNLAQKVEENGQKLATQQQVEQALSQIQQSKSNIAQSGQATPVTSGGTAVANGTPGLGTPSANGTQVPGTPGTAIAGGTSVAGTPLAGTAVAVGSPFSGTAVAVGSAISVAASGTVVAGSTSTTGTPVLVQGTPGQGTPVVAQGQGQGQNQGQGQGQGQSPGQGQAQGQGQGKGQNGTGQPAGPAAGGWGTGHKEQVYSPPSSVNANLTPVTVQGQNNPNGEQSSTSTNTDANNAGSSLVPYEQIYGQYKDQAGNALDSDYIPQGYKDLVKDYFSDIAP
jgi:hypothetical protein